MPFFGPDFILVRTTLTLPTASEEVMNRIRAHCYGRDWSGPRDLLIGTASGHRFVVRRPLALQTPVRCIVRGEVASVGEGSVVSLHFGTQALSPLVFCSFPLALSIPTVYRLATVGLLAIIAAALFAKEFFVTRRLLERLLA